MKNINILQIVVAMVGGVILATFTILAYYDEKPRIDATGEFAFWNTPRIGNINFSGFQSYSRIDIRNIGDSVANDVKLRTPFKGVYSLDTGEDPKEFENDITLGNLNPTEGYVVEIWARNSPSRMFPGQASVNHTRGTENVDFGYHSTGFVAKISRVLAIQWLLVLLITTLVLGSLLAYIAELRGMVRKLK